MTGKVKIDAERCKGCELCVEACAKNCIVISTNTNKMGYFPAMVQDTGTCTGCSMCAIVCPDAAIEVMIDESGSRHGDDSQVPTLIKDSK